MNGDGVNHDEEGSLLNRRSSVDRRGGHDIPETTQTIPGADALGNLWNDRRQSALPIDFPDRRSGMDRRVQASIWPNDRRGTAMMYSIAKSGKLHMLLLMLGDALALVLAFVSAFLLSSLLNSDVGWRRLLSMFPYPGQLADIARLMQFVAFSVVAIGVFWLHGHYTQRRPFWDEIHDITKLILLFAAAEAALVFVTGRQLPRIWVLGTWMVALFVIPLIRNLIRRILMSIGVWSRPTAIIGTGRNAQDIAAALNNEVGLGFHVSTFLAPPPAWICNGNANTGPIPESIVVHGRRVTVRQLGPQLEHTLRILGTPHLVIALETDDLWEVSKLLLGKNLPYSSLSIAPSIRGLPLVGMEMLHFFKHDVMLLRIQNNLARAIPQRLKRGFDLVVASSMLLGLSPLLLFLVVSIRRSGPGVFFGHVRLSQNGKPFKCYKFRTMVPNAQAVLDDLLASDPEARAEWARDFKLRNDPRVTPIGRFLRKSSLDELPQLWNVLRGEMSLVGPRPIIEAELERYEDKKDFFLEAKPGITGLWQISGRNDVSYAERVQLDSWYARNWHLWFDVVILIKTVRVVFGKKGAY
jgi:undecaprenyl-phosphate galactose phosphotransferase